MLVVMEVLMECNSNNKGGTPAYSINFLIYNLTLSSNILTTPAIISSGNYPYVVTDANGCNFSGTVTITQPAVLSATSSFTDESCFGASDGLATVNPNGGTPPYTYIWFDGSTGLSIGQTNQTASGLSAGNYGCDITDANGCLFTSPLTTINSPSQLFAPITVIPMTISGANDGSMFVTVSGGASPYSYNWVNNMDTSVSLGNTNSINMLSSGIYTCTVTDANGCSVSIQETITDPACALYITLSTNNVTCFGGSDGNISANAVGEAAPYNYLWSNGDTTQYISGLSAGTYTCTVTDTNGCPNTISTSISEADQIIVNLNTLDVSCNGNSDGFASVAPTGGSGSFSVLWWDGSTNSVVTNLTPGAYWVEIIDGNGCSIIEVFY